MSAADYKYDPKMQSSANFIEGEVHSLGDSLLVIPKAESFYADSLTVETSNNGISYGEIYIGTGYSLSPLFSTETAATGNRVASFIVLHTKSKFVRLTYHALGERVDVSTMRRLSETTFSRSSLEDWAEFLAPSFRDLEMGDSYESSHNITQAEALNRGLSKIAQQLSRLNTNTPDISLEEIQSLRSSVEGLTSLFEGGNENALQLIQSFAELEEEVEQLRTSTTSSIGVYDDGYVYLSETAAAYHNVWHGLGGDHEVFTDVWVLDYDGNWVLKDVDLLSVHENRITFTLDEAAPTMVIVRKAGADSFVLNASGASFDVQHNLDTYFPEVSVWFEEPEGWVKSSRATVTEINSNEVKVDLDGSYRVKILVSPPRTFSYVQRSNTDDVRHEGKSWLRTNHLNASLWVRNNTTRQYVLRSEGLYFKSPTDYRVELEEASDYKLVLQPIGEYRVDDVNLLALKVETMVADYQTILTTVADAMDAINAVTSPFEYSSIVSKTDHTLDHGLGTLFPNIDVWEIMEDGSAETIDPAKIKSLTPNQTVISLTQPAVIMARLRK